MIGPDIVIQSLGYGCTECILGKPLNLNDPITFVVDTEDVAEYLDIANIQTDENILQAVRIYIWVLGGRAQVSSSLVIKLTLTS